MAWASPFTAGGFLGQAPSAPHTTTLAPFGDFQHDAHPFTFQLGNPTMPGADFNPFPFQGPPDVPDHDALILPKSEFVTINTEELGPDDPVGTEEYERYAVTLNTKRGDFGEFPATVNAGLPFFAVGKAAEGTGVYKTTGVTLNELNHALIHNIPPSGTATSVAFSDLNSPGKTPFHDDNLRVPPVAPAIRSLDDAEKCIRWVGFTEKANISYFRYSPIGKKLRVPFDIFGKQFVQRVFPNDHTGADLWIIMHYRDADVASAEQGVVISESTGQYKTYKARPSFLQQKYDKYAADKERAAAEDDEEEGDEDDGIETEEEYHARMLERRRRLGEGADGEFSEAGGSPGSYKSGFAAHTSGGAAHAKDTHTFVVQATTYCSRECPDPRDNTSASFIERVYPGFALRDDDYDPRDINELCTIVVRKVGRILISDQTANPATDPFGGSVLKDSVFETRLGTSEAVSSAMLRHALSAERTMMELQPEPRSRNHRYTLPVWNL